MQSSIAQARTAGHPQSARLLLAATLFAVAAAAAAVAIAFAPSLAPAKTIVAPADGGYTQVEAARAAAFGPATRDASYEAVEGTRSQLVLPAGDSSYTTVERSRSQLVIQGPADGSYDDIERLRSQR